MGVFDTFRQLFEFNRGRTLAILDRAAKLGDAQDVIMWRPGVGRAHVAWQLGHVGITEDIFAAERLADDKQARHQDLWDRFRGGSTPDDEPVSPDQLRTVLADGRQNLLDTLTRFNESNLEDIVWVRPQSGQELSLLTVLNIIAWHEAHHQGQAHLTLNLYEATKG